ncbi:MAG: imidazole glycerol phosphate synthase subunit HisH, partial [Pseudomonadota bacterium]
MSTVAIIDSGGANIASVRFALNRLGVESRLTSNPQEIMAAERVILPGVGAAKDAMRRLVDANLIDVIRQLTQPVLGVCLGMQLLCQGSEEDDVECLGILPGVAALLPSSTDCPVPNMGWCATETKQHALLNGIPDGSYFYYVHSYALPVTAETIATANHT